MRFSAKVGRGGQFGEVTEGAGGQAAASSSFLAGPGLRAHLW